MKIIKAIICCLLCFFVVYPALAQSAKINLEWELLTNLPQSRFKSEAEFRIHNKGEDLTDKNWSIFFSMAPIAVGILDSSSLLGVEHINGDWYKLYPKKGFRLSPGQTARIHYGNNKHITKEVLAPMGPYMVRYDDDGKELGIADIAQYHLVPFTRNEQLVRGTAEGYGPFSLERVYNENKDLTDIPKDQLIPIIPTPYAYTRYDGILLLDGNWNMKYAKELQFEADYLRDKTAELRPGLKKRSQQGPQIQLSIDTKVVEGQKEGYSLTINATGVQIKGTNATGVFYGVQSLLSLIASSPMKDGLLSLSHVSILDKPRLDFRSLHLDVARNFQRKETVLKTIDILAHYKLNNLLLYTSEDEGWRIEIPGLPELTEIGSQRLHPMNGVETKGVMPAYGSGAYATDKNSGSGFYSRSEFIEILKYAKARHINVIPELNFPGHARAAIIAMENRYQKYMKLGDQYKAEEYRLLDPNDKSEYLSPQYFKDNTVSIGRESSYRFYEKIIDEFTSMYKEAGLKLEKIHAGGDEVAQKAWSQSPEVQNWAADRNVKNDFLSLQAAFFKELVHRMEKKGLEVHGWEEVVIEHEDKKYFPNPAFVGKKVVPYIWNNEYSYPDMGYKLANMGYDVILCNVTNLYFDLAYNNDPKTPGLLWAGFVDTKKAFSFAPYNFQNSTLINRFGKDVFHDSSPTFERLKDEAKARIRGVQAQMWAETILSAEMLESYLLPKLIGFSEMAWSKERAWESQVDRAERIKAIDKDWNSFANRIAKFELPMLSHWNQGYNFWMPPIGRQSSHGRVAANICFPGMTIRYTTDGSPVTPRSPRYTGPIPDTGNVLFKAFVN